jgi:hypothetical protein
MKTDFKCRFFGLIIALILCNSVSLKFKKDHANTNSSNLPHSVKEKDVDNFNKQVESIDNVHTKQVNKQYSAAPNIFDALVVNYKGKNISHRNLAPELIRSGNSGANVNINSKSTTSSNVPPVNSQIPLNQNNLNTPSPSSSNSTTTVQNKIISFIDIEDHHVLSVDSHLLDDEDSISQLELNEIETNDLEDLHLASM